MNLLIVEDNLYFQEKVKSVLMRLCPRSSIIAIDHLEDIENDHSSFDVCFMDIELPDGDGIEFLKNIQIDFLLSSILLPMKIGYMKRSEKMYMDLFQNQVKILNRRYWIF